MLALVAGGLLVAPSFAHADVVMDWNQITLNTIASSTGTPPPSARNLAMLSTAVYNATNGIGSSAHSMAA